MYAMIRNVKEAEIGDTFCHASHPTEALAGFKPAKPMASIPLHYLNCFQ